MISVDGYPHAGNDVFECTGSLSGKEIKFFIKVSRQMGADISNEVRVLKYLDKLNVPVPEIIDSNINFKYPYIITKKVEGERLSSILNGLQGNKRIEESMKYMLSFGASLSKVHKLNVKWGNVKKRRFHDVPKEEFFITHNLHKVYEWLKVNEPKQKDMCFIHGDHHYANILWNKGEISAVLDWELCGIGWKEFDIAWACILRPSQQFMKTTKEQELFLKGYSKYNTYNVDTLNYCKVLIYTHFYEIGIRIKDQEYVGNVTKEIERIVH